MCQALGLKLDAVGLEAGSLGSPFAGAVQAARFLASSLALAYLQSSSCDPAELSPWESLRSKPMSPGAGSEVEA